MTRHWQPKYPLLRHTRAGAGVVLSPTTKSRLCAGAAVPGVEVCNRAVTLYEEMSKCNAQACQQDTSMTSVRL